MIEKKQTVVFDFAVLMLHFSLKRIYASRVTAGKRSN